MKRILVKRAGALGDVILTTGIIRELHEQGNCQIDVVTKYDKVFANNHMARVVTDYSASNYDQVIDLDMAYEMKPNLHVIDSYAKIAGLDKNKCGPELWLTENDRVKDLPEKFIAVHMRKHFWPNRNLPEDFWMNLLGKIISQTDLAIVQIGDGHDTHFGEIPGRMYDLVGKLSIHQCASVIGQSKAFVGADAGLYHVAACTTAPILGLFTAVRAEYREPIGRTAPHISIASNIGCYGCVENYPTPLTQYRCDNAVKEECTRRFDVDDVFEKLKTLIT